LFTHCGNKLFYASYNTGGKSRCVKDLSKKYPGWMAGDIVTVRLALGRHPKVTYLLNGTRVRKVMSLARHETYYPVIVCAGKGVYELVDFQWYYFDLYIDHSICGRINPRTLSVFHGFISSFVSFYSSTRCRIFIYIRLCIWYVAMSVVYVWC